ncbi:MAG: BlaI/MecI/CopY family transcriptional regulator [Lachnospiraceae bacterium]|nr:BlaI/MecI/CopY family transcriptional regulator [Lachnospiraceae bacterium]
MRRNELSECELIVMKCVWDGNGDITCAEVIEKLKTKYGLDYAETTVYTFLKNLKNKGFIETYKNRITRFKPIRSEEEYRNEMLKKSIDFWFDGSTSQLVSAAVKTKKMSSKEKAELQNLVKKLK